MTVIMTGLAVHSKKLKLLLMLQAHAKFLTGPNLALTNCYTQQKPMGAHYVPSAVTLRFVTLHDTSFLSHDSCHPHGNQVDAAFGYNNAIEAYDNGRRGNRVSSEEE